MFRNILSSRSLIAGFAFFVVIVGGSWIYSWHVRRTSEAELEREKQVVQALENKYKTRTRQDDDIPTETEPSGFVDTPEETDEIQTVFEGTVREPGTATDSDDVADVFFSDEVLAEVPLKARVSPHGLGAYPPIPEGAPIAEFSENHSLEMELLLRVAVKKWNEGHRFVGAMIENGRVYLNYPNTVYAKRATQTDPDGNLFHYYRDVIGGDVLPTPEQMYRGEVPPGITVLDLESEGLDPYEVLGLSP